MLKLPGTLNAERFLAQHWQKEHLFMPQALPRLRPRVTRNEIGWLATLDDVESRLVLVHRDGERLRYSAETGPFDAEYLAALPKRDWTLLVHDVEKHLPAMRRLLQHVSFIPDWRIDDLMVSFAAPGGGVGPHRDHYDVFLCQGIGVREWHVTAENVPDDPAASDALSLTRQFAGQTHQAREGDVLYLPPGVAHWGTATRACITYSIGMRAPQFSDLADELPDQECENPFYVDPDLGLDEVQPGYISPSAIRRVLRLPGAQAQTLSSAAESLGRFATETKAWITPDRPGMDDTGAMLAQAQRGATLSVHGMARIAYDDQNAYANGFCMPLPANCHELMAKICTTRRFAALVPLSRPEEELLQWMLKMGVFEIPEIL